MKSQKVRVFEYMKRNGSISQMEAFERLHIVNLPGRIYDLKQDGVAIEKFHVGYKNKEGERVDFDKYFVAANNKVCPSH